MLDFLLNQGVAFLLGVGGGLLVDRVRSARQRQGMLRALLAEISHNEEMTRPVRERWEEKTRTMRKFHSDQREDTIRYSALHSLRHDYDLRFLKTEAWHEARWTGLLPDVLIEELDGYYSPLEKLLNSQPAAPTMREQMLRVPLGITPIPTAAAERDRYVEYLRQVLEAQGRARDRISEYLKRAWWRRIFGEGG